MTANVNPIFPKVPTIGIASLTAAAPIVGLANIVGVVGLTLLTPASVEGKRIDQITVKGKGTTLASKLCIWLYNGVTSFIIDEIDISAVTASNTADAFSATKTYPNLLLPPAYQLYVSQTVSTDVNVFAHGGDY